MRYSGVLARNSKWRHLIVRDANALDNELQPVNIDKPWEKYRPPWAYLLKRTFNIDMQACPGCHTGKLQIIAAIENPEAIKKILEHLAIPTKAPTPWPARPPPGQGMDTEFYY